MMKNTPGIAIALDDCAAIEIINDQYRIIASKKWANAHKVFWKRRKYYFLKIPKEKRFNSLNTLLTK